MSEPTPTELLTDLLKHSIILPEAWQALPAETQEELRRCTPLAALMARLQEYGLLTEFQACQVQAGHCRRLILGNYRVLERIGKGGAGQVFKAEHLSMRKTVALKVLTEDWD